MLVFGRFQNRGLLRVSFRLVRDSCGVNLVHLALILFRFGLIGFKINHCAATNSALKVKQIARAFPENAVSVSKIWMKLEIKQNRLGWLSATNWLLGLFHNSFAISSIQTRRRQPGKPCNGQGQRMLAGREVIKCGLWLCINIRLDRGLKHQAASILVPPLSCFLPKNKSCACIPRTDTR